MSEDRSHTSNAKEAPLTMWLYSTRLVPSPNGTYLFANKTLLTISIDNKVTF